jgi:alkaline phosphatase D
MTITGDWDRRISRRTLLKTGGSFAAGITLLGLASDRAIAQARFESDPFTLGVASGDPTPNGVVLWTRLAPDPLAVGGGLPAEPYEVRYEFARDEQFRHIHRQGSTVALPDEAHSVRVELDELPPERDWYYRFKAGDAVSPVGRTRTTPPGNSQLGTLNLAFVSCQNYAEGYFTPYADVAASDIDAVIFLGDYIYEGGANIVRPHAPAQEIKDVDAYRIRHAQYKTDPNLQAAHAAHPWLVTWDDHEFKNGYADLDIDPNVPIGEVRDRRAAAYKAYWEHMPLARARKPDGPDLQLYRRFHWGKLVTFNVIDGRQYRSDQPACNDALREGSGYCPDNLAADRTMLGADQLAWLFEDLATTKTRWNVLAQQTPFAPVNRPQGAFPQRFIGTDTWDGYVAERQRILDWWVAQHTPNPIVLTGDAHLNRVSNLPPSYQTLEGDPVAVEFVGTSISSNGNPRTPATTYCDDPQNPHIVFQNNNRGYVRCTVTPEAWTSEFRVVTTVTSPGADVSTLATLTVENGRAGVPCAPAI